MRIVSTDQPAENDKAPSAHIHSSVCMVFQGVGAIGISCIGASICVDWCVAVAAVEGSVMCVLPVVLACGGHECVSCCLVMSVRPLSIEKRERTDIRRESGHSAYIVRTYVD